MRGGAKEKEEEEEKNRSEFERNKLKSWLTHSAVGKVRLTPSSSYSSSSSMRDCR